MTFIEDDGLDDIFVAATPVVVDEEETDKSEEDEGSLDVAVVADVGAIIESGSWIWDSRPFVLEAGVLRCTLL